MPGRDALDSFGNPMATGKTAVPGRAGCPQSERRAPRFAQLVAIGQSPRMPDRGRHRALSRGAIPRLEVLPPGPPIRFLAGLPSPNPTPARPAPESNEVQAWAAVKDTTSQ